MEYQHVKQKLEERKKDLVSKMQNPDLTIEEKENIEKSIKNYEYIIELTDMNHHERGSIKY
ncbi:DUF3896 family protein [Cytobacillus sp. FJAT-54145]|uniref:DUF3896 family protein n=1 Tax=Cytobacillus spartinae TaxID=3299023 RepID=A0ABW6K9P7_9BACI